MLLRGLRFASRARAHPAGEALTEDEAQLSYRAEVRRGAADVFAQRLVLGGEFWTLLNERRA